MDIKTLFLSIFIASAFVTWPNLAKPLNLKPGLVTIAVLIVALVVVMIAFRNEMPAFKTTPLTAMLIVVVVAVLYGLAFYTYARVSADKNVQTGTFLVTVYVLQMSVGPIIDRLINGTKLSPYQYVGLSLAAPVIWLLSQRRP